MKRQLFLGLSLLVIGILVGFFLSQTINVSLKETAKVYTGYLVCQMCAGSSQGMAADGVNVLKHPEKHTVNCLRMYTCVKSGFGIFIKNNDESYTYYKFNKKGNDLAYENIVAKTTKVDNVLVEVTGKMQDHTISVDNISEK